MNRSAICHPRFSTRHRGYTLIEVLVVAVIIVLMLGMALPVFRAITGSRSEAGATNVIAAMLNRARTDAVGLQQPYGVAFIYNIATQQSSMAEVYFAPLQAQVSGTVVLPYGYVYGQSLTVPPYTTYYQNKSTASITILALAGLTTVNGPPLEIVPDTDLVQLPAGVGVQTVCNCNYSGTSRSSDGYLSLGVIMFDGNGRLASLNYGISSASRLSAATGNAVNVDYPSASPVCSRYSPTSTTPNAILQLGVPSQFGLVVFQRDAWLTQKSSSPDALYTDATPSPSSGALADYANTGTPTQLQEENWLDQNATPLLIDRYTGTLIRAE